MPKLDPGDGVVDREVASSSIDERHEFRAGVDITHATGWVLRFELVTVDGFDAPQDPEWHGRICIGGDAVGEHVCVLGSEIAVAQGVGIQIVLR